MGEQSLCPDCGSPLATSGPNAGLCPRCLIREGLSSRYPTQSAGGGSAGFDPPDPAELADRFPQLEVLELIGQGGMGAVYKARQPALDRFVALKILAPDRVRDPAFAERFGREARTLARLSHPHIVGIHDFGETDGMFYLVMEYVDGASLREVMRAGRLSPGDALALVPQLCEALQFAHEAGVVHRDIKPENILLDRNGAVKIADFGLAKLLEPDRAEGVSLTVSGAVMGTPAYMAPEQIERPLQVDHRADIYAVGVVFYEMLTGELPLGRFDPPSRKVALDVRLDRVVLRALEKEPLRRYQVAGEVTADLEQLGDEATAASSAAPAAPSAPPSPGSRTITVTRPQAVTWIATYSFVMAAALPMFAGLVLWGLLIDMRGASPVGQLLGTADVTHPLGAVVIATATVICIPLSVWHLVSGLGVLRLRNWSRFSLIVLAALELPAFLLPMLNWFLIVFFPCTALSALVLIYLFRPSVARLFELGVGDATLPTAEADAVERTLGRRSWA